MAALRGSSTRSRSSSGSNSSSTTTRMLPAVPLGLAQGHQRQRPAAPATTARWAMEFTRQKQQMAQQQTPLRKWTQWTGASQRGPGVLLLLPQALPLPAAALLASWGQEWSAPCV